MYKIEKTDYGFRLEYEGVIWADEIREWFEESKKALEDGLGTKSFGLAYKQDSA